MGASGTSRRSVLLGTTGLLCGLVGCSGRSPGESRTESTSDTGVPEHHSTADARATFRVVDTHRPTDDAVTVTYAGAGAIVTGTMDPAGCDRPALASLDYEPGTGSLRLVVAGESPYGGSPTVVCDNASYDYRCDVGVDAGRVRVVTIVHDYQDDADDRTYERERG